MTEQPLAQRAARGAIFTVASQLVGLLVQVISVVVLSRLLSPRDYGLVAIVLVVVAFGETFRDLGLSSASVQAKILTRFQRDNLFWVNSGIGAVISLVVFFAAGLIALISKSPEVIPVAHALSLTFLINGLATQYRASLLRQLRFRALMVIDVTAAVVPLCLAVFAAALGLGYWALVIQQLGFVSIGLLGAVVAARWLPGLPNREGDIRGFLRFGWNLVGSQLIAYLSSNIDSLTVAVRFGTVSLGFSNRAFQLAIRPVNQIRAPMTAVAIPVLARIQDARERYSKYVLVGQLALSYPTCLALGGVAVLSGPIVQIALGSQWGRSAPLLQLLAICAIFETLAFVGYWVYVSRGLGKSLFRFSMVSAAIQITCILVGSQWGVVGVAFGYMLGPAITWPLSIGWLSRVTEIPTRGLYLGASRVLGLVIACAAVTEIVIHVLPHLSALPTLLIGFVAYIATIGVALAVPFYRADAATLVRVARMVRGTRRLAPDPVAPEKA
jgi:O-antigen/teichoic acid export membrane protein